MIGIVGLQINVHQLARFKCVWLVLLAAVPAALQCQGQVLQAPRKTEQATVFGIASKDEARFPFVGNCGFTCSIGITSFR